MIRNRFSSSKDDIFDDEELNPMETVANMADAMLVLAVGIMLALVMAWNVDIGSSVQVTKLEEAEPVEEDEIVLDTSSDTDEQLGEMGLSEYGKVFADEDGNFYVMKEAGSDE